MPRFVRKSWCFVFISTAACLFAQTAVSGRDSVPERSGSPVAKITVLLRQELDPVSARDVEGDLAKKQYSRAEEKLLARIANNSHPKLLLEALAGVFFLDAKYLNSAIAFKKAEQHGALSEESLFTLAMDYVELKKNQWARDQLQHLEKERPAEPLYPYWLGRVDYDDQKFTAAQGHFNRALEIDPTFVRAYDGIGLCDEALGETAAAEENYRKANLLNREQGSHFAWPALNYGRMLRERSRYGEARELLKEALAIDPSLAKAYYEMGRLEESLSNHQAAIANLKQASSLDPSDASPVYSLFRIYTVLGDADSARKMMVRFRVLKGGAQKPR